MKKISLVAAVAVALTLALAGCGSTAPTDATRTAHCIAWAEKNENASPDVAATVCAKIIATHKTAFDK